MNIGFDQVECLIPHRAPFIFVESAEVTGARKITGICCWAIDNPLFQGHFPGFAVVPGVLLVEAVAQLTGIFLAHQASIDGDSMNPPGERLDLLGVLIGIRRATFHKPVLPAARIRFAVSIENPISRMINSSAQGHDEHGNKVCQCDVSVAIVDRPSFADKTKFAVPA